jgi:hypothetical protein
MPAAAATRQSTKMASQSIFGVRRSAIDISNHRDRFFAEKTETAARPAPKPLHR